MKKKLKHFGKDNSLRYILSQFCTLKGDYLVSYYKLEQASSNSLKDLLPNEMRRPKYLFESNFAVLIHIPFKLNHLFYYFTFKYYKFELSIAI
ncbi:hypothetical protein SAMN05443529_1322 [Desulfosporosinus hippei DSM 8344]|uniref:Uncharacterized protein n=1 Tax=Desulfosporosinus hippei DSM 8344 TaxID=1121419 RepID=A0A1G8J9Z7_9FIRM|nr:hypothetical protein SAMN05443529_1322 [Desulfosporosinus hippei DSM 8344]